jgi:hypothetical protein
MIPRCCEPPPHHAQRPPSNFLLWGHHIWHRVPYMALVPCCTLRVRFF